MRCYGVFPGFPRCTCVLLYLNYKGVDVWMYELYELYFGDVYKVCYIIIII